MTRTIFALLAAVGLGVGLGTSPAAASCDTGKSVDDMSYQDAQAAYDCLKDDLLAGYQKKNKRWIPAAYVQDYRSWAPANTLPANPGFHGGRFLLTFVNPTGAEAYMRYAEDPDIPAGTVIAKESFRVTESGKVQKGPLFLMEKVAAGTSPETMDWYYMAVAPNGAPMAVNVMSACNTCHIDNFGHQGGLGYPVEEVRLTN